MNNKASKKQIMRNGSCGKKELNPLHNVSLKDMESTKMPQVETSLQMIQSSHMVTTRSFSVIQTLRLQLLITLKHTPKVVLMSEDKSMYSLLLKNNSC